MAKNFANIYNRTGDSIALNQKFFAVKEITKGLIVGPANDDFFFTKDGGAITHTHPKESSSHRSGRHNTDIIRKKKVTEWNIPTFVNIDVDVAAGITEVEKGIQLLWESLLGKATISSGVIFDSTTDPDITFSLFENGDKWAHQAFGCAVESNAISLPGDGEAGFEWSGRGADRKRVGVGRSDADNNAGNTITLQAATEAKRFPVGSLVMIIEADGLTRSADTAPGTYRTVTARDTGTGVVTLDGAALADADGSGTPVYLAYAEPDAPVGIANIQTGLVGSISVDGLGGIVGCVRSASVTLTNNHEYVDYCYGTDALASPFFVPGGRLNVETELELNLNDLLIEFLDDLEEFTAQDIDMILGDATTRHFKMDLPKTIFDVPSVSVPSEGSIPVTFSGMGFQTALDNADEVTVSYL